MSTCAEIWLRTRRSRTGTGSRQDRLRRARRRLAVLSRGVKPSESEFANACLVEAEVMTNLVTHRLDHV
jgi:hypothetical protein